MLENMNDIISLLVIIFAVIYGLYLLFVIFDKHHSSNMKRREEQFFSLYDEMNDEYEDEDFSDPFYE